VNTSILDLIPTPLTRVSPDEWHGPCPKCGGKDRFIVWAGDGRYWCRQCGTKGDALQAAREFQGCSYGRAAELAGKTLKPGERPTINPIGYQLTQDFPSRAWQGAFAAFAQQCQERLWNPHGCAALDYLRSRGFADSAIQDAGLGFNPQGGHHCGRWVDEGVTIPVFLGGSLRQVNVRRLSGDPKYRMVQGSRPALWGADQVNPRVPAVLVESVLDALSIYQVAGDLMVPLAAGSTTHCRKLPWIMATAVPELLLVAFDADDAGDRAASWWLEMRNARRWRPAGGKDANDLLRAGTLRAWIEEGISREDAR
jgi:DNA primase